jgi:hypothetical protein
VAVGRHRDAEAGPADDDPAREAALLHTFRHLVRVVGVVDRVGRVRADVLVGDTEPLEGLPDLLLQLEAGVVGAEDDPVAHLEAPVYRPPLGARGGPPEAQLASFFFASG